jgi:hypothetical protein
VAAAQALVEERKKFKCLKCPSRFVHEADLRRHLKLNRCKKSKDGTPTSTNGTSDQSNMNKESIDPSNGRLSGLKRPLNMMADMKSLLHEHDSPITAF